LQSLQWTSSSGFTSDQRVDPVDQRDAVDLDLVTAPAGGDRLLRADGADPRDHALDLPDNGQIYANDVERGLDVFSLDHRAVAGAATLARANSQTQERLVP
jgi:hypothetical protein